MRDACRIMSLPILFPIALALGCSDAQDKAPGTPPGVTLIATAALPATASDLSNLSEPIAGSDFPQNRVGSIGSGLAYTGSDDLYIALNDRGPKDGALGFFPRFQTVSLAVDGAKGTLGITLRKTTLFCDADGAKYSGLSSTFDAAALAQGRRLDPEGVRVSKTGSLFTSDEYGPWLDEWSSGGVHLRRIELPAKFAIAHPSANGADELPPKNVFGRQSNRGMEGLARSPDGTRLYGAMQSPLIQDGGLDEKNKRVGTNVRVLEIEPNSGKTREFLYCLESGKNGVNEIVAVDADTFLVLERDSNPGSEAAFKRVYKAELAGASDISKLERLPAKDLPADVVPLKKELLLDFLDPRFGLAGKNMPEKIEGLAFGPDLADGRRLLMVSIDNDFLPEVANTFWAFAIDRTLLGNYQPAAMDVPWKP